MLLALLACQSGKTEDHPDDEVKVLPYDPATDPLQPENSETACDDGYVEQSREDVFGERLCLSFTEVSTYLGLTDSSKHIGVYTFDYNSNGRADIFVSNDGGPSNLFVLVKGAYDDDADELGFTNHYEDRADEVGLSEYHPEDVAPLDFDEDGDIDLAIAGPDGNLVLENSAGVFVAVDFPFDDLSGQTGKAVAWLGNDVIFGTDSGISYINNADGDFENITEDMLISDPDVIGAIAVGDVDGDGDKDFYAAKEVGTDRLFINEDSAFSDEFVESDNSYPTNQAQFVKLSDDEEQALSLTRNGSDAFLVCDDDYSFADKSDDLGLTSPNNTTSATYADLTGEGIQSVYKTNYQSQNELLIRTVTEDGSYGYFYDTAELAWVDYNEKSTGSAALNFNDDGHTDLVSVSEEGSIYLVANYTRFLE